MKLIFAPSYLILEIGTTYFRGIGEGPFYWRVMGQTIIQDKDGRIRGVSLLNEVILDGIKTHDINSTHNSQGIYVFDREFSIMEQIYLNCL